MYITLCVLDAAGSTAGDPRDAWGTQLVERYEQGKKVRIQSKTKANQSKPTKFPINLARMRIRKTIPASFLARGIGHISKIPFAQEGEPVRRTLEPFLVYTPVLV